jgi:hypothetical protein
MAHSSDKHPSKIFVLVDIDDPLTYDKDFQRSIQYSPYVANSSEMSVRNRKLLRARKDIDDELFTNKFLIEIFVDKFGDFVASFLPNAETQRTLIFRKYHWDGPDIEDIPEDVLKQMQEDGVDPESVLEDEQELIHVYEIQYGPALILHDDQDSGEDPAEDVPVDTSELDTAMEEEQHKGKIVVPGSKTVN